MKQYEEWIKQHLPKDIPADERDGVNRVFAVDLENPIEANVDNGTRDGVVVKAYLLEFLSDEKPMVRGGKDEDEE